MSMNSGELELYRHLQTCFKDCKQQCDRWIELGESLESNRKEVPHLLEQYKSICMVNLGGSISVSADIHDKQTRLKDKLGDELDREIQVIRQGVSQQQDIVKMVKAIWLTAHDTYKKYRNEVTVHVAVQNPAAWPPISTLLLLLQKCHMKLHTLTSKASFLLDELTDYKSLESSQHAQAIAQIGPQSQVDIADINEIWLTVRLFLEEEF